MTDEPWPDEPFGTVCIGNGAVRGRVAAVRTVGGSGGRARMSVGSDTSTGVVSGSPGSGRRWAARRPSGPPDRRPSAGGRGAGAGRPPRPCVAGAPFRGASVGIICVWEASNGDSALSGVTTVPLRCCARAIACCARSHAFVGSTTLLLPGLSSEWTPTAESEPVVAEGPSQ